MIMKNIGAVSLSFAYAVCFFGAGFVSGQELWQFFGAFGQMGYVGFFVAVVLFVALGIILIRLTQATQIVEVDLLLVPWDIPWLRKTVGAVQVFLLFCVVTVMTAGVAALGEQLMGVPTWIGGAVFAALIALVAMAGVSGMVRVFSALIPVLVAATLLFSLAAYRKFGMTGIFELRYTNTNPLMPHWLIASFTYVAYNMMGAIGMMTPLGNRIKSKHAVYGGILLGGLWLLCVAAGVLTSIAVWPAAAATELPMVALAAQVNPTLGSAYGVLLFLGMFCTSLSSLVADMTYFELKFPLLRTKRKLVLFAGAVMFWAASLLGFGDLIGVIYPIFGYCGVVFLGLMIAHYVKCKKEKSEA